MTDHIWTLYVIKIYRYQPNIIPNIHNYFIEKLIVKSILK